MSKLRHGADLEAIRMTEGLQSAAASVAHAVRELRPAGIASVLWTVVVCVALWHCPKEIIQDIWPALYRTWLGIVGAHVAMAALLALWERPSQARTIPAVRPEPAKAIAAPPPN